ncbi:MAG TPA: hypothetical protein VHM23_27940 [Actinomycetota bacterium]|jgi:hypothetical protein|nr:hypothetical protein [Actinomycetota bacterium]
MGNSLEAGTGAHPEHSLASYFEDEFNEVRRDYGLDPLPEEGREDRMMLFLGIARGIVRYLGDHGQAFAIEAHDSSDDSSHDKDRDGYLRIRVDGSFGEHP